MNDEVRRFLIFLCGVIVVVAIASAMAYLIAMLVIPETAHGESFRLTDVSGGINNVSRFNVAPNQIWKADNLLINNNTLEARKGYFTLSTLSDRQVRFLDVFHKKSGQNYMMMSDGEKMWYAPEITGTPVPLSFGRSNVGTVHTAGTYVGGDTVLAQRWMTLFGRGEGLTMTIGSTNYTIEEIYSDTSLKLTTSAGTTTGQTFNIEYQALEVSGGLAMSDNYWIYTTAGRFAFNSPDSFIVVDPITGSRFQYTNAVRACGVISPNVQFTCAGVGATGNYNGMFLRIVTEPNSEGTPANPITGGHPIYLSYPIRSTLVDYVYTYASAFAPATPDSEYFTIEDLEYDSTYNMIDTFTTVSLLSADSAGLSCTGRESMYLVLTGTRLDSSSCITGDWFFAPRYAWSNGLQSFTGTEIFTDAEDVFPVVGGFQGGSGEIYVAVPPVASERSAWTINGSNKIGVFYRMTRTVAVDSFVVCVAEYDNRVFQVNSVAPQTLKYTDLYNPAVDIEDELIITDPSGEAVTAMLRQGDRLRVYTDNNRYAINTPDGFSYLINKVGAGIGCVAKGTLAEKDGIHYYLHSSGVFRDDGAADLGAPLSQNINSWFTDSLDQSRDDECAAAIYENRYWISFPMKSGGFKTFICDLRSLGWTTASNLEFAAAKSFGGASDSLQFFFGDTDSGIVYSYHGETDRGVGITATLQTPWYDFVPGMLETYRQVMWSWEKQDTAGFTLSMLPSHMDTARWSVTVAPSGTFGYQRVNPAMAIGNNLSVKLLVTNAAKFKLGELEVIYAPKSNSR